MNNPVPSVSDQSSAETTRSLSTQLKNAWLVEFSNFRWSLLIFPLLARLLPQGRAVRLRTALVRAIGLSIDSGTRFFGMPKLQSSHSGSLKKRLRIGSDCTIGTRVILEFGELLTIGDRVSLADGVVILTTTHQLGPKEHRAGALVRQPVVIGNDAVIGTDSIILPGATIGEAARILPNSVVTANVAAGATVSGIPARPVRNA